MKLSRSNRRKNDRRRQEAAAKQAPTPLIVQRQKALSRRADYKAAYPTPPAYNPYAAVGNRRPPPTP